MRVAYIPPSVEIVLHAPPIAGLQTIIVNGKRHAARGEIEL